MAKTMGLRAGWAMDLTAVDPDDNKPWDFSSEGKRNKAKRKLAHDKPLLVIVSPMCGPFSQLQDAFNYPKMPQRDVEKKLRAGM